MIIFFYITIKPTWLKTEIIHKIPNIVIVFPKSSINNKNVLIAITIPNFLFMML